MTGLGACRLPVTRHGEDRRRALPLPVLGFPLTPHCSWGPSAFPLLGRLGMDCFYEMNMTQKGIQHDQLGHLKESSAVLPILKCLSSCLLKHSLNQRTWSLPGEQQHNFGTNPHNSRPPFLHRKSEKFLVNYQK